MNASNVAESIVVAVLPFGSFRSVGGSSLAAEREALLERAAVSRARRLCLAPELM